MYIYDLKIVQSFMDFVNFIKFRRCIRREMKKPFSRFNELKLKRNWLGNMIYVQLDFSDADLMNMDYNHMKMLDIKLKPIIEYLSSTLNWGEYLVPQISNFVDDSGNPTLSYGVIFIYTGYSLTMTKAFIAIVTFMFLLIGAGIAIFAL